MLIIILLSYLARERSSATAPLLFTSQTPPGSHAPTSRSFLVPGHQTRLQLQLPSLLRLPDQQLVLRLRWSQCLVRLLRLCFYKL
jgi:hypothetical protein